jgi:hypothetical protein
MIEICQVKYLNNIIEQDHRFIKKITKRSVARVIGSEERLVFRHNYPAKAINCWFLWHLLKYKNSNKAYGISEDKFDNIIRLMFESDNSLQQKNKTHIVNGFDIFIDEKDSLGLSTNNKFEPFETKIVNKLIHEGDVVLDIGANVGYYSLLFSKLVGNRGNDIIKFVFRNSISFITVFIFQKMP